MTIVVNARYLTKPQITGVQRHELEVSLVLRRHFGADALKFYSPPGIAHTTVAETLQAETVGTRQGHQWEQLSLPASLRRLNHSVKRPRGALLLSMGNTMPLACDNGILTLHDTAFLNREWVSWKFSMLYRTLVPLTAGKARRIVTVSDFSRQELATFLKRPASDIDVIYNGVSPDLAKSAANALRPDSVGDGDYILAVSSLDPRKNFLRLVQAFQQLNPPGLTLCIVGDSHRLFRDDQLKAALADAPNIKLLGRVNDEELAALYKHARLFAFPSLYEGFGLPPLEAMSCGCPTVVSRVASLPEVCGEATHYIEDPTSIASIADAMDRVLTDEPLRHRLIERGYEQARQFTWEKAGAAYRDLILQTV